MSVHALLKARGAKVRVVAAPESHWGPAGQASGNPGQVCLAEWQTIEAFDVKGTTGGLVLQRGG